MAAATNATTSSDTAPHSNDNEEMQQADGLTEWIALSEQIATALDPKTFVYSFWKQATRPDGRPWMQVRPTTMVSEVLSASAAGSALIRLGDTHVVAAVAFQVGQTTNVVEQGDILVQIERANQQQYGSTATTYTALQGWVQRILSDTLDLEQLSIKPGWAWRAVLSLHVLQDAGSTRDAVLLAAVASLQQAKIPIDLEDRQGKLWIKPAPKGQGEAAAATAATTKTWHMPIVPISLTMGHWRDPETNQIHWMLDPTTAEEAALDGSLTMVVAADALWGIEFVGESVDFAQQLPLLQALAVERAKEIQGIMQSE